MIRLWSGDLSRYTTEPCACGRTYRRLPDGLFGRADDMLVIRGENVYPAAIEEAIRAAGCDGEFRVEVVRERTMDELTVRAEAVPGCSDSDLQQAVLSQIKKKLGLRAAVQIVRAGSLERTEFKARRISDRRDLSQELKTLQPDALFVWGLRDRVVPIAFARHVTDALPRAQHLELDCGHVPQVERPRQTHAAVGGFLAHTGVAASDRHR